MKRITLSLVLCTLSGCASTRTPEPAADHPGRSTDMRLGNFSVSLAIKDLEASREFYEKLGFRAVGGNAADNWLILQNETSTIGIFQGMLEKNTLTYNPGWDRSCSTLADFDDVREIQRTLVDREIGRASCRERV